MHLRKNLQPHIHQTMEHLVRRKTSNVIETNGLKNIQFTPHFCARKLKNSQNMLLVNKIDCILLN